MSEDDFSDHPVSVGELRGDRSGSSSAWSPRDALISVLRDIDAGRIDPTALVVCWRESVHEGTTNRGFVASSQDPVVTVGLLHLTAARIIELG